MSTGYDYRGNGWSLPPAEAAAKLAGGRPRPAPPPRPSPPKPRPAASGSCHISRLAAHTGNIRDGLGDLTELADSIHVHGILQPLIVREHPQRGGDFIVLAGHRRLAAARLAGLDQVPIVIRETDGPTADIEIMLVENCQRSDLGPVEKAEAMGKLRARGYTAAVIAKRTGLSASSISYYLSLLELDESARAKIRGGQIRVGDAIEAVRLTRQRARKRTGRATPGAAWEPDYFTGRHPLARRAASACDAREHTMRRRIGKIACGQCWETVIRADERAAAAAIGQVP